VSITIREIAKHTGLSIPTVGNVLGRAAHRYSAETRKRVQQACEELGYRPNASARAMRQGRLGCAALVLSRSHQSVLSHIPIGLLDGLDDELARHNMHLTVSRLTDEQLSSAAFLPKVLREYMADGMIVNYTHEIPRPMLEVIRAHHTPAVWLNAKLTEDCVYPDDLGAAQRATQELIARGHQRIALLHLIEPHVFGGLDFEQARPRFHYSVADRTEGYTRAMRGAGLTPHVAHNDRFVPTSEHVAACRTLLSGRDRPTAVLLYSENDLPALLCAASELRLSIPRDLSVLEFFPVEPSIAGMRVSVVPIPTGEMGRRAAAMLLRKIEEPSKACAAEAVPYRGITTDTIAPPVS
jgi:DNA-binding LacI/PurR family transcriptional regulator